MNIINQQKKEYLQKYLECLRTENELNDQLNCLRDDFALPRAQNLDGMPHAHDAEHDLSDYAARLDELLRELQESVSRRIEIRRDITQRISSMSNESEVTLLFMRYIRGYSFEEIAVKMQYSWRHALRIHGNALSHFPMKDVM